MAATCYWPDGTPATDAVPCNNSTQGASSCCLEVKNCLANGLCLFDGNNIANTVQFARRSCTDPTWTSPSCFQQCLTSAEGSASNSSTTVFECNAVGFKNPAEYCCDDATGSKNTCCQNQSLRFVVAAGVPTVSATNTSTILPTTSTSTTQIGPITTRSPMPTPSSLHSNRTLTGMSTDTSTGTSTNTITSIPPLPSQGSGTNADSVVRMGIALIAVGGFALLIALVIYWVKYRQFAKNSRLREKAGAEPGTVIGDEEPGILNDNAHNQHTPLYRR